MSKITPLEIEMLKRKAFLRSNRPFLVQIMDKETRTVVEEHTVEGWEKAHRHGYRIIAKSNGDQVVRVVDPTDASCYDFLTKERLEKISKGGKYNGNKKE